MKTACNNQSTGPANECPVVKSLEKKCESVTENCLYSAVTPQTSMEILEALHISNALNHYNWNKTETAKSLGISLKTLYNKIAYYNIMVAAK